eukprot:TRINITY_DN12430_c0_g1_i3.p1 TRINITY_DN12430_c0_g1~~TRINITY_DN12430_c0_g1_i3.p1  ORF type:complete len:262 (+),score=52.50 TRINITY_DN12430_c0_g1_i3:50-835(+)
MAAAEHHDPGRFGPAGQAKEAILSGIRQSRHPRLRMNTAPLAQRIAECAEATCLAPTQLIDSSMRSVRRVEQSAVRCDQSLAQARDAAADCGRSLTAVLLELSMAFPDAMHTSGDADPVPRVQDLSEIVTPPDEPLAPGGDSAAVASPAGGLLSRVEACLELANGVLAAGAETEERHRADADRVRALQSAAAEQASEDALRRCRGIRGAGGAADAGGSPGQGGGQGGGAAKAVGLRLQGGLKELQPARVVALGRGPATGTP